MDADIVSGECLLAVTGIDALLTRQKLKVTKSKREAAVQVPFAIRKALKRFLTAAEADKPTSRPFTYSTTYKAVNDPPTTAELQDMVEGIDPDAETALLIAAGQAINYLRTMAPSRTRMTVVGPKSLPPSDAEISRFGRAYWTCQDPMTVFEDLCSGTLTRAQIEYMRKAYPGLYELTGEILASLLIELKAERPNWEPSWQKTKLLGVLLGQSAVSQAVVQLLSQAPKNPEVKAAQQTAKKLDLKDADITPSQRTQQL